MADREPGLLLWLDLETTGSDEHRDEVIELATVLTDLEFRELGSYEAVVLPHSSSESPVSVVARLRESCPEAVREMHDANGLWEAVAERGVPLVEAEQGVLELVDAHARGQRVRLAGSGVGHFDRRFLRVHTPLLDASLHHAPLDVGQTRRLLWLAVPGYDLRAPERSAAEVHRAMPDVRGAIAQAKLFVDLLRRGVASRAQDEEETAS